jgi:hypothetical protein
MRRKYLTTLEHISNQSARANKLSSGTSFSRKQIVQTSDLLDLRLCHGFPGGGTGRRHSIGNCPAVSQRLSLFGADDHRRGSVLSDAMYGVVAFWGVAPFLRDKTVIVIFWIFGAIVTAILGIWAIREGKSHRLPSERSIN